MKNLITRDDATGGYWIDGRQFQTIEEAETYLNWRNKLKSDWSDQFRGLAYYRAEADRQRYRYHVKVFWLIVLVAILVILLERLI